MNKDMDIKKINNILRNNLYKGENLSLPFVLKCDGKDKLAYFAYNCSDSDEILEITEILKLIIVDYDTTDVMYSTKLPDLHYPIKIHFDLCIEIDELNKLYEQYYDTISKYLTKQINWDSYQKIAHTVFSNDFVKLLEKFGAKI